VSANNDTIYNISAIDSEKKVILADSKNSAPGTLYTFQNDFTGLSDNIYISSPYLITASANSDSSAPKTEYVTAFIKSVNTPAGKILLSLETYAVFPDSPDSKTDKGIGYVLTDGNGTEYSVIDTGLVAAVLTDNSQISAKSADEMYGAKSGLTYDMGRFICAVSDVSKSNLKVVAYYDENNISSDVFRTLLIPTLLMLIVWLIGTVVLFVLIHKFTEPLNKISADIASVTENDTTKIDIAKKTISPFSDFNDIYDLVRALFNSNLADVEFYKASTVLLGNVLFDYSIRDERIFVSDNYTDIFTPLSENATLFGEKFIAGAMDAETAKTFTMEMSDLLKNPKTEKYSSEYMITDKFGEQIWISVTAMEVADRHGEKQRIIGVISDITEEKLLRMNLEKRINIDFLSGLYNRATFLSILKKELEQRSYKKLAIIFIDVDDFKFINDRYSHAAGDGVIKHVAGVLSDSVGKSGFCGRFGGDEFVVCITDSDVVTDIEQFAYELIQKYAKGYLLEEFGVTIKIKTSMGISISPQHGKTPELLVSRADEAMYFVKKHGKSNYHLYVL
jgi:diguanylate cyclase (GGDEF)-like protein